MSGEEIRLSLLRGLVWDMTPHDLIRQTMTSLDLVPPSEEGFTHEHFKSHARTMTIAPIDSQIQLLCGLAAEVTLQTILGDHEDESGDLPEAISIAIELSVRAIVGYLIAGRILTYT